MTINRFCKTRGLGEEEKQEHMKNWSMWELLAERAATLHKTVHSYAASIIRKLAQNSPY